MKKIMIACLLTLGCFSGLASSAEKRTVTQWGGETHKSGADTYKIVKENDEHTKLNCEQPGDVSCCWANGDDPMIVVNGNVLLMSAAYNYVLTMIAQNVFTGTVTDDNGVNSYSWQARSPHDFEFTFDGR